MTRKKYRVDAESEVNTFVYLYFAARNALLLAKASENNRLYNCMGAIVFSAFCLEAYLNHIGSIKFEFWDDELKKDLSSKNKLKMIAHEIGYIPDTSRPPFQSFSFLFKFRNQMAHGKSEVISESKEMILQNEDDASVLTFIPETWWQKQCNLKVAEQSVEDVKAIVTELSKKAGLTDRPFGTFGGGTTGLGEPIES